MEDSHDDASRERFFSQLGLVRHYAVTYAAAPAVKYTLLALGLLASLAATGCAASGAADDDGGLFDPDSGLKPDGAKTDGGNKDSGNNNGQCPSSCASDFDCQNSCPDVPNGINCCDTSTGICYAYASTMCPAPVDAGFD